MEFGILGRVQVSDEHGPVHVGGRKPRTLLAALLVHANEVISSDRLATILWPAADGNATNALHTQVSRLRAAIDPGSASSRLVNQHSGYLLHLQPHELDAARFEILSSRCRDALTAGDWAATAALADQALACWRGPALDEFRADEFARPRAAQLDERRLLTLEWRVEAQLALGRHRELIGDLEQLVAANPLRESLWSQLILALYRSDRQSDALRAYERLRQTLDDELGIVPSPALTRLEQDVLTQDPALDWRRPPREAVAPVVVGLMGPTNGHGTTAPTGGPGGADAGSIAAPAAPEPEAQHNLPRQLTSFVGREVEQVVIADLLTHTRLLTLTGSGGCGKTRLALAVAEAALPRYPDGIRFVDFAAITDPTLIPRAIAGPLGVETDQIGQLDLVCRRIADEQLLLVLDNCEHVVEAAAEAIEELLIRCPSLQVLATSREELRLGAESVYRVSPLSLPQADTTAHDRDPFMSSEALELFVERGRAALEGFAPNGESLQAVAQICRRLDGIPLAIELAAALVGSLPVADIAARLDDRFVLLAPGRRRQGAPHHRTLRATLDWSFDLLDPTAQDLFVRLGVFVGDFTLAAAEAVAGTPDDPLAVVNGLGQLVSTSVVAGVAGRGGTERYRMLETVRQYAKERLDERPDTDEIHRRHADYYRAFAAEADRNVHGPAAAEWLARVVLELPNLRTAIAWAFAHDDIETGLRLANSLRWFFGRMALLDEAIGWLDVGLKHRGELSTDLEIQALATATNLAFMRGEFSRTRELGDESVALARQLGDPQHLATTLIVRGAAVVYEGDLARAEECFVEAQELCTELGDRWGTAWMLATWGVASRRAGHYDRSRQQFEEALALFRSLRDHHGQVMPLIQLAIAAQESGRLSDAATHANEAADIADAQGDRQLQHITWCVLGRVELTLGNLGRARQLLVRSIRSFPGAHNHLMVAIAIEGLAGLAGMAGCHVETATLLGFTQQMRQRWQISVSDARAHELQQWLEAAQAAVGKDRVTAELRRGGEMSLDDVLQLAETATGTLAAPGSGFPLLRGGAPRGSVGVRARGGRHARTGQGGHRLPRFPGGEADRRPTARDPIVEGDAGR